jgi:hypothetical protein
MTLRLLLVALALLAAGCASAPKETAPPANATVSSPLVVSETNATMGTMPHVHDYWKGRERVTVVDQDYESDATNAVFWLVFATFFTHEPMAGGAFVDLPEGQTVYEGTGAMEITVAWTDPTVAGLRMTYHDAGTQTYRAWAQVENAKPLRIDVTPGMCDMPHAKASRWSFILGASGPPPLALGKFHVKIDIVKLRDLSLFPPHPDFWQGSPAIGILQKTGAKTEQGPRSEASQFTDPIDPPADAVPGDKVVPMETQALLVNATVTGTSSPLPIDHLNLYYHAADQFVTEFHLATQPRHSADGKTWSWVVPVSMNATDNPYAKKSDWAYRVTATHQDAPLPCGDDCVDSELTYDIDVRAVRGAET